MSEFRYPQPANEHDFEEFCLVLMREVWNLPSLEQFGHRGERQHGIDLLDLGESVELRGVQCKHHEPHKTLPPAELEAEVIKAKTLPDEPLTEYWVLTTAKKSTATQRKVREINKDHGSKGLFRVVIKFWDDIERLIDGSPAAQRYLQLHVSDAAINSIRTVLSEVVSPLIAESLHAGLDEARTHLASGDLPATLLTLRKTRSRSWAELSGAQKAAWLTIRADVAFREGKQRDAARLLLEAYDHTPDDEIALVNAVGAKRMLGDPAAVILATEAIERFPSSPGLWGAAIGAAATAAEAIAFLERVPSHLRDSPQVMLAVAGRTDLRASHGDITEQAVIAAPADVHAWYFLGDYLVSTELAKTDVDAWQRFPVDPLRVERALEAFGKVVELCSAQGRVALKAEALLQQATAHSLLNNMEALRTDVEGATACAPADSHVTLARARLLLEEGAPQSAIPLLRELVQRGDTDDAEFLLATALWRRNSAGDNEEATRLMKVRAERSDPKAAAHLLALDGMLAAGQLDDAKAFVAESAARLGALEQSLLVGRLSLAADDREGATQAALKALAELSPDPPRRHVAWVGRLLVQVARYQEALPLLERLAADASDVEATKALVFCASRLGRHGDVMAACARARAGGIYDGFVLSTELPLLVRYDPDRAIMVLQELLVRDVNDHRTRVHLVDLALRLEQFELAQKEAALLPPVSAVLDVHEGAAVAKVLLALGKSEEAIAFAYDLLRRFFAEPQAHRIFIHVVLWRDRGDDDGELQPERAGPGHAVCLRELGDAQQWFVLEDSTLAAPGAEGEVLPSHGLWSRLIGCSVGDQIELAAAPGLSRKATVVEVLPKRVYRFRDAMSRWQYRFPEHQEIWTISATNEATGDFDPSPLFDVAKARKQRDDEREDTYRTHRLPVCALGMGLGLDALSAALHVITTPGLPLRCSVGNQAERDAAFAALDSATELVLDATALGTLYVFGLLDVLRPKGLHLMVPHSLMALIRTLAQEAAKKERASGAMGATADGPSLHLYTDDEKAAYSRSTQELKARLEEMATVVASTETASLQATLRTRLEQVFDASTLDAVAIAGSPTRVLWTDDATVAYFARTQLGAATAWTQVILLWLVHRGSLDEALYAQTSAKLAASGYEFTSLSPRVMEEAGHMAQWRADRWPLKQVVGQLGLEALRFEDCVQLAALLVRDAFKEPLPIESRRAVLFAVCDALALRTEGHTALQDFESILTRVFGLNVVGEQQALEAVRDWKKGPRITPPKH